jgi:hypothetical protein
MLRLAFVCSSSIAVAAVAIACGSKSVTPPRYVAQPQSALAEVPYPPPPARVEFIPDRPDDDAVWIDGEWTWRGRRYTWKPGRWVRPLPNAAFAPWTTVRDAMGTLYLATGTWRDGKGAALPDPTPIRVGAPSQGVVVDPEGEQIPRSPLQPPADPAPVDAAAPGDGIVQDGGAGVPDVLDHPADATPLDARTTMVAP